MGVVVEVLMGVSLCVCGGGGNVGGRGWQDGDGVFECEGVTLWGGGGGG